MPTITPIPPTGVDRPRASVSSVLEEVLLRYSTLVRNAARRHNLSESDVDEVLQDVRIRLWRALSSREKIAVAPASYVYRAAVSAALDLIRRRRARPEEWIDPVRESLLAGAGRPDQAVEAAELADRVAKALSLLCESRRLVVRMHLVGYHRREIAEILGWTEAKTRNLLYRGLSDLRERLQKEKTGSNLAG